MQQFPKTRTSSLTWLEVVIFFTYFIAFWLLYTPAVAAAPVYDGLKHYQDSSQLTDERRQKLADDVSRYQQAENLWDVLRGEFTLSHYEEIPAVQEKIEWFMNNQDFLLRSANRAAPYLYYILQQVKKRHLPAELVLLPIVESGYNPYSLSNVGAAGIWQLMPTTATGLGVKQDWWYDGRRDVIASTRAALNYLAYLQSFFDGNWLLAIAAYNTGEGNVMSAIKRNIRAGLGTDFWSLPVAQQTKDYVPSLLALAVIISNPERYPVYFPPIRNAPYLAQVGIAASVNLKQAATYAGISYKKILQLNPGFRQPTASLNRPYKLVLPIENVADFTENLASAIQNPDYTPRPQVRWLHYKVKAGDTLTTIASKFQTTPKAIKQLNHITKNAVHYGNHLLIPSATQVAVIEEPKPAFVSMIKKEKLTAALSLRKPTSHYIMQPGDTIYMVRKKDSVASIAKRFRINGQVILSANRLRENALMPGTQLIIPTHRNNEGKTAKSLQPGDTVYIVRKGDTIAKISRKFHTPPSAIRLTNLLDDNSLEEGKKIIIPTGNKFRV